MYERFTDLSAKVFKLSQKVARLRGDTFVGVHHVLIALIEEGTNCACNILKAMKIDAKMVANAAAKSEFACKTDMSAFPDWKLPHTPRMRQATEFAIAAARELGHNYIGTEHILLGILQTDHVVITEVLKPAGATPQAAREIIMDMLGTPKSTKTPVPEVDYKAVVRNILAACDCCDAYKSVALIEKLAKDALK